MSAIKLFKIGELEDGTIRFATQLSLGSGVANFIMEEGVLKAWGKGEKGFSFYEYIEPYEIVEDVKQMAYQAL